MDDGAGNFWMGSDRGILRAGRLDLHRCADGAVKSIQCLSYGKSEGLASLMCSAGFQPGAAHGADGRLWFPTAKGLAIVDPAEVTTNRIPPQVRIEEFRVDARNIEAGREKRASRAGAAAGPPIVAPGHQRFEFHYTGLSFTAPDKVRFKHKLAGLETDWVEAETRRVVEYSYLRPGQYEFRVMACNNDGVWNEQRRLARLCGAAALVADVVVSICWRPSRAPGAVGSGVLAVTRPPGAAQASSSWSASAPSSASAPASPATSMTTSAPASPASRC